MARRIEVLDLIELDDGLGLFGGQDLTNNEKVTFHLRGENATNMARRLATGERVLVEVP